MIFIYKFIVFYHFEADFCLFLQESYINTTIIAVTMLIYLYKNVMLYENK